MGESYTYEIRKYNKVVGYYTTLFPLIGRSVIIPEICALKQPYNRKIKVIEFPIGYACISNNGVDYTIRRYLCANHKSTRQIQLVKDT